MPRFSCAILLRRAYLLGGIILLSAYLGATSFWTPTRHEQLFGHETVYFHSEPVVEPLTDYRNVFAVGHNAGYSTRTVAQARSSGANVIEIDVVLLGDTLVSAHVPQMAVVGSLVFRGPTLESVWNAAGDDAVIQLDLKESTTAFRKAVITFLDKHSGERTVLVATPDTRMLQMLADEVPDVLRFLSVRDRPLLDRLLLSDELANLVDGVTIRHQLVTQDVVASLKDRDLIVLAWTVNDLGMVNDFVAMGVDGFSTNNLAIMEVLSTPDSAAGLRRDRNLNEPVAPEGDAAF